MSNLKSFNFNQNGGLILDQTQVAAMASMWFTLYPAEDTGFGLTTPDGVTHLFEYDYDNVSSATYPIQVRPAEDSSLSGVALSTVAAINATNLFDAYYKDRDGMPYIYIYQKTTGISGNRTNTNFFNNSITGFTGGEGSSITFNDGSVQTSAINKFVSAFGNTSDTSYVLKHNLNTEDVTVTVIEVATKSVVYPSVTNTSSTQITVDFSEIPASANSYKAIVIG